jgi:hypothetical protein
MWQAVALGNKCFLAQEYHQYGTVYTVRLRAATATICFVLGKGIEMAICPATDAVVTTNSAKTVTFLEGGTGKQVWTRDVKAAGIYSVAINPNAIVLRTGIHPPFDATVFRMLVLSRQGDVLYDIADKRGLLYNPVQGFIFVGHNTARRLRLRPDGSLEILTRPLPLHGYSALCPTTGRVHLNVRTDEVRNRLGIPRSKATRFSYTSF